MSLKSEAIKRFLTAAKSLADQGLSKEAIIQFAKNEFGQINELFQKQIDNIFKPKQGIENIKIKSDIGEFMGFKNYPKKDEVFDDTVIKLPIDDTGQPFNPRNPMKEYGKMRYRKPEEFDTRKQYEEYLDSVLGPADDVFGNPLKDDLLAEFDKVKAKNVTPRDEKYTGGMVDVKPSLSDIGHGSDALMARTRLMSPGAQATTSTGLNYLLAEDNDNIRVPFSNGGNGEDDSLQGIMMTIEERQKNIKKLLQQLEDLKKGIGIDPDPEEKADGGRIGFSKGKGVDLLRRGFLKAMGAAGAGITGLKTGLLGLGKEAAPVVEKTVETVTETAQNVPPYFLNLVNKIKNLGTKFKGPTERSESYRFKDYEMDVELDTGKIDIKKTKEAMIPGGDEAGIAEEVYMTYKPGRADETTRGKKVIDEYEEFTARPDEDGKMKDVDGGVPDEVIEEGTIFEDNIKDFGKADGGPITATEIPLKPAVKDINKKGQPYTTMYSLGGIARLLGE